MSTWGGASLPAVGMRAVAEVLSRQGLRGREIEIGRLDGLVEGVRQAGTSALGVLRGEPGIGKTALLDEAITRARAAGFSVGLGRADELDQIAPLASLVACLRHGERPLMSCDAFARLSHRHDQRIWLVEQLAGAIEARAVDEPVLIALDDVHWADPLSRFALGLLPVRLRTSPVLWLLTSRDDHGGAAEEIALAAARDLPARTVRLGPLSGTAMDQLARDTLGEEADDRVKELLEGAGGNPFLAVEMLAGVASADPASRLVPGVRGRLGSLPTSTLRFLQTGAVLGRRFTLADAAALLGRPPVTLLADLESAVRGGLLEDDGDHLSFRHDLLRQAIYADVPPSARKALHREAAAHLVTTGRSPMDAAPHILIGAVPGDEQAIALLGRAAHDVLPIAPALAADLAIRALELAPVASPLRFEVGEQAIVHLTRAGRNRQAVRTGQELLALRPSLDVFGRLQAALGDPLWNLSLAQELRHRAESGLDAGGGGPHVQARLAALRALAMSRDPDLEPAREAGCAALAQTVETGDRQARVTSLLALGEIELNAGRGGAALSHFTALRLVDEAYTAEEVIAHQHLDDYAAAERLLAVLEAEQEAPRPGMLRWAQANHHLGLGRLDDAEAELLTMQHLERNVGESVHQVNAHVIRCWIACLRGEPDEAGVCLEAARQALADKPDRGNQAAVAFAEAIIGRTASRLRDVEGPFTRWRLLRTWIAPAVRLALRDGDQDLAGSLAAQADAHAALNPGVPTVHAIAAQVAGLVGDDLDLLAGAHELARSSPRPLVRADIAADLGLALMARGRGGEALSPLNEAHDTFTDLGAHGEAARVRAHLETGSTRTVRPVQGWQALTATEKKVARLIAAGHTNRSAAGRLVVSPHTINTHLTSVYRKLAVNSRVQLTHIAMSHPED